MPGRTVTHGGVRTPESAGRPRRPGVKTQGTVECFPRIAVVPVGGGGRSLSRPRIPMFHGCHPSAPASLRSPVGRLHVAVTVRLRRGTEGRASRAAERNAAKNGYQWLSPDPRHGRYAPSDRGLRAPCTRRPRLIRSHDTGFYLALAKKT